MTIELNMFYTTTLAVIVLIIGRAIVKRVGFLQKFSIPTPVVGGLLFTIITLIGKLSGAFTIKMDLTLSDFFMLVFYASIGFTATFSTLKKGGKKIILFLILSSVLVILQNGVGVFGAKIIGQDPLVGIGTASIPMTGGHGTSAAFTPVLEDAGLKNAATITLASATFGLVSGALLGGPIGEFLVRRTRSKEAVGVIVAESHDVNIFDFRADLQQDLSANGFTRAFMVLMLTIGVGTGISELLKLTGFTFPASVGAMLASAILINISGEDNRFEIPQAEIKLIGDVFLSIFLAYSMMKLKLWELADLAVPLLILLFLQVILMVVFAFIDFKILGGDYEAAITTAGHCGFALGAVPTGVANMKTLTAKYGDAPQSFFIVPLVGSLFINLVNSLLITFVINLFT